MFMCYVIVLVVIQTYSVTVHPDELMINIPIIHDELVNGQYFIDLCCINETLKDICIHTILNVINGSIMYNNPTSTYNNPTSTYNNPTSTYYDPTSTSFAIFSNTRTSSGVSTIASTKLHTGMLNSMSLFNITV